MQIIISFFVGAVIALIGSAVLRGRDDGGGDHSGVDPTLGRKRAELERERDRLAREATELANEARDIERERVRIDNEKATISRERRLLEELQRRSGKASKD